MKKRGLKVETDWGKKWEPFFIQSWKFWCRRRRLRWNLWDNFWIAPDSLRNTKLLPLHLKHLSSRNWLWQDKWIALSGLCLKYKVPCWHRFWHKSLPRGHIYWCNLKNWTKLIMIVKNKFQKLIQQDHDQEESSISLERNMISCLMKIWLVFIEICQICSYICQWGFRQHIELKSCKKYLHWNKDTLNN